MWVREIEWMAPVEAAERLRRLPGLAFLDSALEHPALGRWSFVAADPFGRFTVRDGRGLWNGEALDGTPLAALKACLAAHGEGFGGALKSGFETAVSAMSATISAAASSACRSPPGGSAMPTR
jgi:hypothetical protein